MVLRFLTLLLLFSLPLWTTAQQKEVPINSQTIFKDVDGNIIPFSTFLEWTSGTGYKIMPSFDADDNLIEVFLLEAAIAPPTTDPSQFTSTPELVNRVPPDFEVTDINGKRYVSEDLKGKIIVLKFWFAACKPCIDEMPQLNTVVEKYKNNSNIIFLAPSLDKKSRIQSFLQKHPFLYNIIPQGQTIANNYNVLGYPTHVVINRTGRVEAVFQGVNRRIDERLIDAIERGLVREDIPDRPIPSQEEVEISPASIIKNEAGERVPFEQFVELMRQNEFELLNATDEEGNEYVLMKKILVQRQ